MAKEYIEREPLIKGVRLLPRLAPYNSVLYSSVQRAIFNAPTADVVEVKHGRWIEREESLSQKSETIAQCSVCGEGWLVESAFPFESCVSRLKHCPNCGAKMDLKESADDDV